MKAKGHSNQNGGGDLGSIFTEQHKVTRDCEGEWLLSLGSLGRLLVLFPQRLCNSLSVADVAEKIRSPWNEILPSTLLYVRITYLTMGTLCLRVGFHTDSPLLSGPSSSWIVFYKTTQENYWPQLTSSAQSSQMTTVSRPLKPSAFTSYLSR